MTTAIKIPEKSTIYRPECLSDPEFVESFKCRLGDPELIRYFEFITDMPREFLCRYAGRRYTHGNIAEYLGIPVAKVSSYHKAIRRAYQRHLDGIRG